MLTNNSISSALKIAVDIDEAGDTTRKREVSNRPGPSARTKTRPETGIAQDAAKCHCQCLGITGWDEEPGSAVLEKIHDPADACCDDWKASGHRFEDRVGATLQARREGKHIHSPQPRTRVGLQTDPRHRTIQAKLVREFTQVVAERTITDDEELRPVCAEYCREGMKKNVDSLPMYETRNRADHQLVTRRTQGLGRVSSL